MHGLGTHGSMAAEEPMAAMPHAVHEVVGHDPVAAVVRLRRRRHGVVHDMATCVAVLTLLAGTALLLLLAARSRRRRAWSAPPSGTTRPPPPAWRPDPPDLMRWSVLRC